MEFEFSLANEKDLPRIVDIYNQIIPSRLATADLEPVTVAEREAWYHSFTKTHPLWVIKNNEQKVVGWVGLEPFYGRAAYEHTCEIAIYIDKSVRHHGLGTQAINFVISQLPQLGITAIVAYILVIICQVQDYSNHFILQNGEDYLEQQNLMAFSGTS